MDINELDYDLDENQDMIEQPSENDWEPASDETEDVQENKYTQALQQSSQPISDKTDINVLSAYLQYSGISDPEKIKFVDDDGLIKERSWNDLSAEEQFNILSQSHNDPDTDLNSEEIELVNQLRRSGLSLDQFIYSLRNIQPEKEVLGSGFNFDSMSDDQIYLIDLASKSELTDEEAESALNVAKQNPELFQKQVAGIRQQISEREEYIRQSQLEQQQGEQIEFENSILDSIENFTSLGSLDINMENDDMNDLADFIIPQNGISAFGQALNNPNNLVKAAWFLRNGDRLMEDIQDYISSQLYQARQAGYNQGVNDARKQTTSKVVYKQTDNRNTPSKERLSIEDLNY